MIDIATMALLLASTGSLPVASAADQLKFGIKAARQGLWSEARFRFERAVALEPENPKALNNLAVACEREGDFEKARQLYERALELKPKDSSIQQNFDLFRESDDKRSGRGRRTRTRPRS